jgi:hypothetical protein
MELKMANSTGGAGSKKHGRDKAKCQAYRQHNQREKNKIKRILKSNGLTYATDWCKKNEVMFLLKGK